MLKMQKKLTDRIHKNLISPAISNLGAHSIWEKRSILRTMVLSNQIGKSAKTVVIKLISFTVNAMTGIVILICFAI